MIAISVVDLTTLGADVPVPDDPGHPLLDFIIPEELPREFDPLRFHILELMLRQCLDRVTALETMLGKGNTDGG